MKCILTGSGFRLPSIVVCGPLRNAPVSPRWRKVLPCLTPLISSFLSVETHVSSPRLQLWEATFQAVDIDPSFPYRTFFSMCVAITDALFGGRSSSFPRDSFAGPLPFFSMVFRPGTPPPYFCASIGYYRVLSRFFYFF